MRGAEDGVRLSEFGLAREPFGQTEIAHERLLCPIEENIAGFEIAMENSVLVSVLDCMGDCRDIA